MLPVLDFAGVPENKASLRILQPSLIYAPDSPVPQELVGRVRNQDAYNWGYNPVHWMVPEGSYAQNPDGENRMREFRTMIQRYNQAGLRVILDVVFNHTYASGIEDFSIFDRVVPFYYHRYNERGELMKSSCCADIATENKMVEKLILDSLVFLATAYKVDGFRFDLLNLHPKMQIPKIREALLDLTPAKAGVDGTKILLYAEAWPFGSLEDLFPGSSFNQLRSYGLGMGAFNDRFRDALRGGTTDAREKSDPGFATGLYWDFNHDPSNTNSPMDPAGQKEKILSLADVMKVGLAGNLRDFIFRDHRNNLIRGGELNFRGAPVGYAAEPNETITYVSAHDGSTLWDAIQAKLPFSAAPRNPPIANLDERVRTMKLLLGTIAVSQGIPFFEGATELLRSKSGDVDSYDSGDWFNQIDWTFQSNNWGVGLPPLWRNQGEWGFWQPRLINPILRVDRDHILSTREHFKALLSLRKSMPLLRLSTAADIKQSVSFPVDEQTGADLPGLIAMFIQDVGKKDRLRKSVLVLINSAPIAQEIRNSSFKKRAWQFPDSFGPQQDRVLAEAEWNENQGLVKVPGRTVLVLEERQ